jgi:hypothetical protein
MRDGLDRKDTKKSVKKSDVTYGTVQRIYHCNVTVIAPLKASESLQCVVMYVAGVQ